MKNVCIHVIIALKINDLVSDAFTSQPKTQSQTISTGLFKLNTFNGCNANPIERIPKYHCAIVLEWLILWNAWHSKDLNQMKRCGFSLYIYVDALWSKKKHKGTHTYIHSRMKTIQDTKLSLPFNRDSFIRCQQNCRLLFHLY